MRSKDFMILKFMGTKSEFYSLMVPNILFVFHPWPYNRVEEVSVIVLPVKLAIQMMKFKYSEVGKTIGIIY